MQKRWLAAIPLVLLGRPAYSAPELESNCSDILRFGVFDEHTYQTNKQLRTSFEEALCNTDFGSYQEARSYGIGVEVPVYGVPIKISGNFDSESKKSWFSEHCGQKQTKKSFDEFIFETSKTASPVIAEAWTRCMLSVTDAQSTGLKCNLSKPTSKDIVFSATWIKGHKNDSGPVISWTSGFGGQCEKIDPSKARLTDGVSMRCTRKSEKDTVAFMLQAETSRCLLVVPGFDFACAERRFRAADNGQPANTIAGDTAIRCGRILFEAGAVVRIQNGAHVEFSATDSIAVVGAGGATVDGTGEPGRAGLPAPNRGDVWTSQGDDDYWKARAGVEGNPNHPDRGPKGGKGWKGGQGASIVFNKIVDGQLTCTAKGGAGGPGGSGGRGRLLRNGRQFYCNGCMYDRPGEGGDTGDPGDDGSCSYLERERKDPSKPAN